MRTSLHRSVCDSMLKNKRNFFILFNFIVGVIILTTVLHFLLSISIKEALIAGIILSSIFDIAYLLKKRRIRERRVEKLTTGDKITIVFITLCGIILMLGIHHIAVLPLLESFAIALIVTILAVLSYVRYAKKAKEYREGKVEYSFRHFILEMTVAFALGLLAYLSGLDLPKSAAVGLFIFILTQWYYHMLLHKYSFTKIFVALRLSLIFTAMTIGWRYLVKASVEMSFLIALIFTLMVEIDRRFTEKVVRLMDEKERRELERRAGAVFQPLGLIYGMVVGIMAISKIYGTAYFAEWQSELYRLAYIFAVIFEIPLTISSWIKFRLK